MDLISDESFLCVRHPERHKLNEVAYNLPDAVFALSQPEVERQAMKRLDNEDTLVIGKTHFVRGWAGLPVQKQTRMWGFGFWIRISPSDFADFEKRGRVHHPKYAGTVANQGLYGAPTLGLAAEMEFRGVGQRPLIRFTDDRHPLTALQKSGVSEALLRQWLSDAYHDGDPQPAGRPFQGKLETEGWEIHLPSDLGKVPVKFESPPKEGDTVKVVMEVLTADLDGALATINAGWWVRLDDVSRPDLWSGTLASDTRVQATIMLGSRIWLRPDQVVQHDPGTPTSR